MDAAAMQLSSLQQTVNLSLMSMQKNMMTAQATAMVEDMKPQQAPHPSLGKSLDISV